MRSRRETGAFITFAEVGWVCSEEVPVSRVEVLVLQGGPRPPKLEDTVATQTQRAGRVLGSGCGRCHT